jgi:hypothetical protein
MIMGKMYAQSTIQHGSDDLEVGVVTIHEGDEVDRALFSDEEWAQLEEAKAVRDVPPTYGAAQTEAELAAALDRVSELEAALEKARTVGGPVQTEDDSGTVVPEGGKQAAADTPKN